MSDFVSRCFAIAMLSSSASSSSAEIVKINSRPLEPGELKRLDKQEKECIVGVVGVVKGREVKRKGGMRSTGVYFLFFT